MENLTPLFPIFNIIDNFFYLIKLGPNYKTHQTNRPTETNSSASSKHISTPSALESHSKIVESSGMNESHSTIVETVQIGRTIDCQTQSSLRSSGIFHQYPHGILNPSFTGMILWEIKPNHIEWVQAVPISFNKKWYCTVPEWSICVYSYIKQWHEIFP